MVRLYFCTVVMPDEYNWEEQFEQAMKDANKFHKRHHEECPPPYFAFDAGKVYGLVLELQRMKAAQQSVQADGAMQWRWADDPCPKCQHVHRAYGAEVKHCPICQRACNYYGEASFVSPEPPRN